MSKTLFLLEQYGLSEREAKVYLHLLEKLEDSVLGIAKSTNIPRTTVYTILTNLKSQNLVSPFRKNKLQYWSPENINQLKANVEKKEEIAHALIPLLKDITSKSHNNDSSIRLFTGLEGLKVVWEDIISCLETEKPPFVYAVSHTDLYSILPKYFPAWVERRRKSKVFAKLIVHHSHEYLRSDAGQEVRVMPEKYIFTGDLTIYGKKVALFVFEKDRYESLIIDSLAFTQMIQGIFNYTWDNLGESAKI